MDKVLLGNTGLHVSKMCFGSLVMGPLQANLSIDEGVRVLLEAVNLGVNFIDTAELYQNYEYIRKAIEISHFTPIISTKCYAYDKAGAISSLEKARRELDMDVIDIFCLHEQENEYTLKGHQEALEYFYNQKSKGTIKAVGVSTHHVACVNALANMKEIDVIHPIINKTGVGIADGTVSEMLNAIGKASENGKGIYTMKALGGGNLLRSYEEAMDFVLDIDCIDSIAVGMQSVEEVRMNVEYFTSRTINKVNGNCLHNKSLHVDYWCEGCGKCVDRCGQAALSIVNGKAVVNQVKCVLCGYCASVCKSAFALKIY